MNGPAVAASGLEHAYGETRALNGVSFEVARGEIFGFLGPNGSGKTTLFRILSTLLPVTRGSLSIAGLTVSDNLTEVRKRIGVVFQSPSVDVQLKVDENLRHHGHLYGLRGPELDARIRNSLENLGLSDRAHDLVDTLSGGLRRRVELAKGLLTRPDLLILDEPSTGLDPGARRDLWNYVETQRRDHGTTVLVTTHLIDEAERCDRLAIMDKGTIITEGTPDTLRARIGGEVITIQSSDPDALASRIETRFSVPVTRLDGRLRLEQTDGHVFIKRIFDEFGSLIDGISLGRPTLEDVFVHETGHTLWDGPSEPHAD